MTKHDEYMDRANWAEMVPFDRLFGAIVRPQAVITMRLDDEPHPAIDGMESDDE